MINVILITSSAPDNLWEKHFLQHVFFLKKKIGYHTRKLVERPMICRMVINLILNTKECGVAS